MGKTNSSLASKTLGPNYHEKRNYHYARGMDGKDEVKCTKRPTQEVIAYMKRPDIWPTYHGFGGAFEMDVNKYFDFLGCQDNSTGACPYETFDLALDVGANTGVFIERMLTRHWAKNYIMVEANPDAAKGYLNYRWTQNETWLKSWFDEMAQNAPPVRIRPDSRMPRLHVLNYAISNTTQGEPL